MNGLVALYFALLALIAPAQKEITFAETIAPILYRNCVSCHRPGEAAPFSLISYDDARKRGPLIATVTRSRYMPPWHAAHGFGEFEDERRLTDGEISAIASWVNGGMPQGDVTKMPPLPVFTEGWQLGQPDLILEMPASFDLPASGPDIYRNFVVPTNLTTDKWVRAIEFRASARKAVHHVLFGYDTGDTSRKLDGADGRPGFSSSMGGNFTNPSNSGSLGGWATGNTPRFMPDGLAIPLPRNSDIVLQMHFHPTGKPEAERAVIGIYFADKAPDRNPIGVELPPLFGFGAGINIPAGSSSYTIEDTLTLPVDARAYGVFAHAHYVAKEFRATATLPDGTIQPLVWIQDWDFNWQDIYSFKTPLNLPKGTRIDVRVTYDNSAANPRNPANPPIPVLWGEQTSDEMASINILMATANKEDEPVLGQLLSARQRAAIQRGAQDGTLKRMLAQRAK